MQTSRPKGFFPMEEITRTVEDLGYECVGIQQTTENDRITLRVYIDSLGGITVKDCERVSRKISLMMDEMDEANPGTEMGRYFLEVSSPGVERPLFSPRDYSRFLGKKVHLSLKEKGSLEGVLLKAEETELSLVLEDSEEPRTLPFEDIEKGHLVFEFEVKQHAHKPKKSGASKKKKRKR